MQARRVIGQLAIDDGSFPSPLQRHLTVIRRTNVTTRHNQAREFDQKDKGNLPVRHKDLEG